jgi:predicted regulator of Ras-like GTPase activity (Roadblock/LC7/MglB family)
VFAEREVMTTRQAELVRVLEQLANELPDPDWVALVDDQGFVMACVPEDMDVEEDRVSAMTAALVSMGERVLQEVEGGSLRFANVSGSKRQYLAVVLTSDRLLSIGLRPGLAAQVTFKPLSRWVPELLKALQRRYK